MIRLEMKNYIMILTEKQQKKKKKISSGKTDGYQYLTGEEILPSNQRQIAQPTKIAYSPLEKVFYEKQTEKQACAKPF